MFTRQTPKVGKQDGKNDNVVGQPPEHDIVMNR